MAETVSCQAEREVDKGKLTAVASFALATAVNLHLPTSRR